MTSGAEQQTSTFANEPQVAGAVLRIPVDQIELGTRLREVDPVCAETIGRDMARAGQHVPIQVCRLPGKKSWRLVAGAHRLQGARITGQTHILAIEVASSNTERLLREISENLCRRELDPYDRARFIAELIEIRRAEMDIGEGEDGRAKTSPINGSGSRNSEGAKIAPLYDFAQDAADRVGLSERSVKYALALYRGLPASRIETIRQADRKLASNAAQLRLLAGLEDAEQASVVDLLQARQAKNVADAIATVRSRPKPNPRDKRINGFLRAFTAMPPEDKRAALTRLASELGPKQADHLIDALKKAGWA